MIFLQTLRVENFRGVLSPQQISIAIPTQMAGSGLTLLVGPNNVGKSTILEALRVAVSPPSLMDRRERHTDRPVRISITDTANKTKSLTNQGMGAQIHHQGESHPKEQQFRLIPSRRPWTARTSRHTIGPADYWTARTRQSKDEDNDLVGRLNSFSPEEKAAFQAAFNELAPQIHRWKVEYSDGSTYLEYTTINGAVHTANLFGDGISSLFRIALALYDADFQTCVVIDEPELSLHPQAQRRLANFLSKKSADRQIILSTHSPYFVSWDDLVAGARVYRLRQNRDGIQIKALSAEAIDGLRKLFEDWEKPQLLDPVAREVFFADEVVFFEGQEDIGLIRRFVNEEKLVPIQTFGYGVGGAGNIKFFLKMASDLDIPAYAVFDGSSRKEWDEARNLFSNIGNTLLPTEDIRDKPSAPGRKARDGLFNRNGSIKLHHRQYLIGLIAEIRSYLDEKAAP